MTSPQMTGETAPDRRVYAVTGRDALTFLQAHPNVDPARIGASGSSAGASAISTRAPPSSRTPMASAATTWAGRPTMPG